MDKRPPTRPFPIPKETTFERADFTLQLLMDAAAVHKFLLSLHLMAAVVPAILS